MSLVVISGFMVRSSRIFRWCFESLGIFVRFPCLLLCFSWGIMFRIVLVCADKSFCLLLCFVLCCWWLGVVFWVVISVWVVLLGVLVVGCGFVCH